MSCTTRATHGQPVAKRSGCRAFSNSTGRGCGGWPKAWAMASGAGPSATGVAGHIGVVAAPANAGAAGKCSRRRSGPCDCARNSKTPLSWPHRPKLANTSQGSCAISCSGAPPSGAMGQVWPAPKCTWPPKNASGRAIAAPAAAGMRRSSATALLGAAVGIGAGAGAPLAPCGWGLGAGPSSA